MQDQNQSERVINKKIPHEIDHIIFGFFGPYHLARIARVSRLWNELSNIQLFWVQILEREGVAFDRNKNAKLSYKKLMELKKAHGEAFNNLCKSDVEAARMVFSNQALFNKLTADQVALKISGFGHRVLEVAFSLSQIVSVKNKDRMIMHAEEHQGTAEFIVQHNEIWPLLNGSDLVKIAIHPEVGQKILHTQALAAKLVASQVTEINESISQVSMFTGFGRRALSKN